VVKWYGHLSGKADGAGTVFCFVGIINSIVAFILLGSSLTASFGGALAGGSAAFNIAVSLLVLIFAFTWMAAGLINLKGYDIMPLGNAGIFMGAFMLVYAVLFAMYGAWWFFANVISWAWAFWSVTLLSYGRVKLNIVGWTFVAEAIYTLWVPAAILLLGIPLP
jgi:hypothetical protein